MTTIRNSLSNLRWKFALFIFRYYPLWAVKNTIRYIPTFKPTWTFWTCLYDTVHTDVYTSADYYIFAFIFSPIWFPLFCIDYFLITSYYSHFPELLI